MHIHTKSDLVLRDLDLLSSMEGEVGVTVTGLDERRSKMLEPGAPLPEARLRALRELSAAGVDAYALIGPVLDHLEGHEDEFCDAIASTGVRRAVLDRLNLRPELSKRTDRMHVRGSDAALENIRTMLASRGLTVEDAFREEARRRSPCRL